MSQKRRAAILAQLQTCEKITGEQFAQEYNVTRQVIVKDIAILRASGQEISSTPRGYFIPKKSEHAIFVIKSEHEAILPVLETELLTIVNHGGRIIDVIIDHHVYHEIRIVLDLVTPADVQNFIACFAESQDEPLLVLTHGVHYHTIEVETFEQEQAILAALAKLPEIQITKALDK